MIDVKQVEKLIENAVNEAAESGTAITLEYIDKSTSYDGFGGVEEQRNIEIRVRAVPSSDNDNSETVEIQPAGAYTVHETEPEV